MDSTYFLIREELIMFIINFIYSFTSILL